MAVYKWPEGSMRCSSVVIADRYPLVLLALRNLLAAHRDFKIVASCGDGISCMEAIRTFAPDIAILGFSMADIVALEIFAVVNSIATQLVFFTESSELKSDYFSPGMTSSAHCSVSLSSSSICDSE
jgi:DNA-binding NarL/FixJ family response regulator